MVSIAYDHIWDCCCDHGLLGIMLLERRAAKAIHFVDVVEPLIAEVKCKLERTFPDRFDWQVHCQDVSALKLPDLGSQLIIIAGVGGDLIIDLVRAINRAYPQHQLEFILCPIRHNYKVRKDLIALGFGLINEKIINEGKQFYEVIHVSVSAQTPISKVGSIMWDLSKSVHQQYLSRTLAHYQRLLQRDRNAAAIIKSYQELGQEINLGA
jgi:tRNA (adenine22-N1)-methyltransferase